MASTPKFGLWFDFRHPVAAKANREQSHSDQIQQIADAEALGFDSVWLTEHHFQADGYTPSPLVIAAAIGSATSRLRIGTNLLLLPLYHPIRLAEDTATLSLLTGGRFDLGVGAGYVEQEYITFGRNIGHRPSLMEEGIAIIRQAWSGEPVCIDGKRYRFSDLSVTPTPESTPRLLMGAVAAPAITRAARLADGFLDSGGIGQATYLTALETLGKTANSGAIYAGCWDIVTEDPERTRRELGPSLLQQMQSYQAMGSFPGAEINCAEQAISQGFYRFLTVDEMIEALLTQISQFPQTKDIHFWGRFPGESNATAFQRMELLASKVIPPVREMMAAAQETSLKTAGA